jgi:hypothetical protein
MDLGLYQRVVLIQQLSPTVVTQFVRVQGGVDDVGEKDSRQNTIPFDDFSLANPCRIASPPEIIIAIGLNLP